MKVYQIEITSRALAEIEETFDYLSDYSPHMAKRWIHRIRSAIESLQHQPERCSEAPENEWYNGTLRQLLHGSRPHVYRVLFEIRNEVVYVLRVRHGRQDLLTEEDVSD